MASAQQISANRANAQKSSGPVDTSRTKFNGTRHGLTSKQTVIAGEDPAEYATFADGLTRELHPQSETEKLLAERMVAAAWRLRRFTRMETAFFNNRIDAFLEQHPDSDPDSALANLFSDPAEAHRMRLFLRYQTAVQREFDTAQKQYYQARRNHQCDSITETVAKDCETDDSLPDLSRSEQPRASSQNYSVSLPTAPAIGFASYQLVGPDATSSQGSQFSAGQR